MPYEKIGENEPVCIADEVPFEIPESWEWVRLKNLVCKEIKRGKSPKYTINSKIQVFAQKCNVKNGGIDMSLAKYLDENIFSKYPEDEYMQDKDIVINSTGNGTLGRIGIFHDSDRVEQSIIVPDSHVTVIRASKGLMADYLFHALCFYQPYLEKKCSGSTNQTELKSTVIAELYIPLPPVNEQNRIISKIKEVLRLAKTYSEKELILNKYNLSFPEQLKKSILQYAVQGKLVPQNPADEPASVLLDRIRAEKERLIQEGKIKRDKHESVIYRRDNSHYEKLDGIERCIDDEIPFEIPDSWEWVRFFHIASFQNGDRSKNYPNRNEYVSNGVAWINTGHITSDGFLNVNTMNYITEEKYNSLSSGHIQKGDLVYCLRGATFGKVARIEPFSKGAIASSLMIIRPFDVRLGNYIYWYLRSPIAYIELHKYCNGSAQPNLAAKDVGKYLVPIPPLDEQIRIVDESIRLLAIIENM